MIAYSFDTVLGIFHAAEEDGRLVHILLPGLNIPEFYPQMESYPQTDLADQMKLYLAGRLRAFDLPLPPFADTFTGRVLQSCAGLGYGQTCTYRDLARAAGNEKASRAAGSIMAHNALPIVIPCHRVLYTGGGELRYAGGTEMKRRLLELEGVKL